jgi:hypothetical protein
LCTFVCVYTLYLYLYGESKCAGRLEQPGGGFWFQGIFCATNLMTAEYY